MGADGWSFEDVRPYFERLENVLINAAEPPKVGGGPVPISLVTKLWNSGLAYLRASTELGVPLLDTHIDGRI